MDGCQINLIISLIKHIHTLNNIFVGYANEDFIIPLWFRTKIYGVGNWERNQDNYKTVRNFNNRRNAAMIYFTMQPVSINEIIHEIFDSDYRDGFVYSPLYLIFVKYRSSSLSWRHRAQRLAGSMSLSCAHAAAGSVRVWKSNVFRANYHWPVIFRFPFRVLEYIGWREVVMRCVGSVDAGRAWLAVFSAV